MAATFCAEPKSNGNQRIVRAISTETLLTTMECVEMSVALTDPQFNMRPEQEDSSIESFVSESVEDEFDDDSEEEVLSLVLIEVDLQSCDIDQMSDVSDVSADDLEELSIDSWFLESPALPVGEI
jgi:hypothetical protein